MKTNTKTFTRDNRSFTITLVDDEIKEYDFVITKHQFDLMDENGKYLNGVLNKQFDVELEQVKLLDGIGLIACSYSGSALQKSCSKFIIEENE